MLTVKWWLFRRVERIDEWNHIHSLTHRQPFKWLCDFREKVYTGEFNQ